jgi:Squalene/phytoene synthase
MRKPMPDIPLPPAPEDFVPLLPKRLIDPGKWPALVAMSDFMALTRSVADDPKISVHLKPAYMVAIEGTLTTQEGYVPMPKGVPPTIVSPGFTLRRESDNRKIPVAYGRRIVQAYKQDASKKSYRDWSELLATLRYSAGSCAGFTVEALGLDKSMAPVADALALAHAVLVRTINVRADWDRTQKIYLPQRWLGDAGLDVEEPSFANTSAWLKVRDQALAQMTQLLKQSVGLKAIADWRLRLAFAWAKADISVRSQAIARATVFPLEGQQAPSRMRLVLATLRVFFRKA